MDDESFHHSEHLPLTHTKIPPIWITAESSVALLIVMVFPVAVVGGGKLRSTVLVLVRLVAYPKVTTSFSKYWTIIFVIVNCFLWFGESHFFLELELEKE